MTLLLFLTATLSVTDIAFTQNPPRDNLNWVGMERALQLASEQDKFILIDVYAEWCPYCQRMQSEVYPHEDVEEQVRKYFIPVRINTESNEKLRYLGNEFTQAEFAGALQNRSVPTTYFMNADGEVVGQQPGFLPVDVFAKLLEFVGSGAFEEQTFQEFENQYR
jgi:thioredoxin-related protein